MLALFRISTGFKLVKTGLMTTSSSRDGGGGFRNSIGGGEGGGVGSRNSSLAKISPCTDGVGSVEFSTRFEFAVNGIISGIVTKQSR